jgi:ATP-dependent Clp protease adaptor protein ClpS
MAEAPAPAPPDIETEREIRIEEVPLAEPELEPPYKVLIHNDDVTPMEFVVAVLRSVFALSGRAAMAVMLEAHYTGISYVATLPHEEAKYRVGQAHGMARAAGYPLTFSIEPE